jgi:AAA domain
VIIRLNGPFGVGKTTVARILVERLGSALPCDPEPFGSALRAVLAPMDVADDFQELRAWPALVVRTAAAIQQTYGRTLVMPITVLDHARSDALTTDLRDIDPELHLFHLAARKETLRTRILRRPEIDVAYARRQELSHQWDQGASRDRSPHALLCLQPLLLLFPLPRRFHLAGVRSRRSPLRQGAANGG